MATPAFGTPDYQEADDLCDLCLTSGVHAERTTHCGKTIGIDCGCDEANPDGICGDPDCPDCSPVGSLPVRPGHPDFLTSLRDEYANYVKEAGESETGSTENLEAALTRSAWTPDAARELVTLAKDYGYWFLRHALALALALDIEEGRKGF